MSNTFTPNGFLPVRRQDGAAWSANRTKRLIAKANTHSFFRGDPIINLNTGYIDRVAVGSIPTQGVAGIFDGCDYLSTAQGRRVWSPTFPGSDAAADVTAYIIDDPMVVWRAWVGTGASSAAGGPAVLSDVMNNISYQMGTGNTTTGLSGAYVDYASTLTTNTLPFVIVGLVQDPPGMNGTDITTAGNLIEVVFNQAAFKVGTTGV